jgi:hypothetical protein
MIEISTIKLEKDEVLLAKVPNNIKRENFSRIILRLREIFPNNKVIVY